MITVEHWASNINKILDEYNLSKENFWKNPEEFIDTIEGITIRVLVSDSYNRV